MAVQSAYGMGTRIETPPVLLLQIATSHHSHRDMAESTCSLALRVDASLGKLARRPVQLSFTTCNQTRTGSSHILARPWLQLSTCI